MKPSIWKALPFILAALPASAAVNDLFPNDFYALPEGRSTLTGYLYERKQAGFWAKGQQSGDFQGTNEILALRFNRFYQLGGWKVAPVAVVSASNMRLSGNSVPARVDHHQAGLGDLRLGGTVWFIDQPETRHFLALNLMTVWPTGSYDKNELANAGENRRRQALTLGWIKGLSENLTLDLAPEIAWYGKNTESFPGNVEVKQKQTLSLTGYLRYRFSPQWHGFVGGQLNEGGETRVNGVDLDNPIHGKRVFLGGSYVPDGSNSINFRFARDTALETGLKTEQEFTLRWVLGF